MSKALKNLLGKCEKCCWRFFWPTRPRPIGGQLVSIMLSIRLSVHTSVRSENKTKTLQQNTPKRLMGPGGSLNSQDLLWIIFLHKPNGCDQTRREELAIKRNKVFMVRAVCSEACWLLLILVVFKDKNSFIFLPLQCSHLTTEKWILFAKQCFLFC